ncbi:hypothetical protein FRA_28c02980 [Francisella sp. W12-1067]|nr:hypothetical protein FRA_28c02980 [Francisella sp. W12-1067]
MEYKKTKLLGVLFMSLFFSKLYAGSKGSELCIINQYSQPITIKRVDFNSSDWENKNTQIRDNFQGKTVLEGERVCSHLELNKSFWSNDVSGPYTMYVETGNDDLLKFSTNQNLAFNSGPFTKSISLNQASAPGDSVFLVGSEERLSIYIRAAKPDNTNWMEQLINQNPNLLLNQLIMPATHDSGVYQSSIRFSDNPSISEVVVSSVARKHPEWYFTNDLNITEQLRAGVRFFDVRVGMFNGKEMALFHQNYDWGHGYGVSFNKFLEEMESFITTEGKNEVIFLYLAHAETNESSSSTIKATDKKEMISTLKSKLDPYFYKQEDGDSLRKVTLSELKGKIVPLLNKRELGTYIDSKDGLWGYVGYPNISPENYTIYDKYSETASPKTLVTDQNNKLENFGGLDNYYWFLYSFTLTGEAGILDIRSLAARVSYILPEQIHKMSQAEMKKANIVSYDFVNAWQNKQIIDLNFD